MRTFSASSCASLPLGAVLFILSSCSWMDPQVIDLTLDPKVTHATVNIGNGAPVQLVVVDQRTSNILGKGTWRPPGDAKGLGLFRDEVYVTKQDVRAIMERVIQEGLSKLGFTVGATREPSTRLSIEIRSIEIQGVRGHTVVALRAIVNQKGVTTFERTYKADASGIPRAFSGIEEPVNLALADVCHQLLGDLEMLGAVIPGRETTSVTP